MRSQRHALPKRFAPFARSPRPNLARNAEHVAAARMTHDVVNELPRGRFVTYDELEAAWRRVVAARAQNAAEATGSLVRRIAREAVDACALRGSVAFARRECVGGMHNRIMQDVNTNTGTP